MSGGEGHKGRNVTAEAPPERVECPSVSLKKTSMEATTMCNREAMSCLRVPASQRSHEA